MSLNLQIVTPEGEIFSGDVKSVVLPGSEGEFGVLEGHVCVVTLLKAGVIRVEHTDGSVDSIAIDWGYVNVGESGVSVLANGAVFVGGSDKSKLEASIKKAKALLESAHADSFITAALSKVGS